LKEQLVKTFVKLSAALVLLFVVVGLLLVWQGPALLMRYPSLLGTLGRLNDPIGPTRAVEWQAGPARAAALPGERPPNIVVILVDDLGWNDLSWNGGGVAGGTVPTPNIDSIARDGVEFSMGYAGNATCAPSRAAIMTGRYPTRFGFESTPAPPQMAKFAQGLRDPDALGPASIFHEELLDQIPPMREQGVPSQEITIAELLRGNGYHAVMLGKWHLGETQGMRPDDQGFEFLGFREGGQFFGDPDDPDIVNAKQDFDPIDQFLWPIIPYAVRKDSGPRFTPDAYMTDYLSDHAARAIAANRNRPFFLYLAYNAPHTPLQATRKDYQALSHIDRHAERVYAAMIRALDRGVGVVLDALRAHGLEENTLVLFSSDNGGAHYIGIPDLNAPYRGWKMTFFEGGLHSPFFLKWPARLPQGTRVDEPVAHIDVFTTAAAAAGAPLPSDRVIDGVDLLPLATGEARELARRPLFWRSGHYKVVLADGFKLMASDRPERRWLYDLRADPTEQHDLSETRPEKRRELQALLDAYDAEVGPPAWPALVEAAIPVDRHLAELARPGDEYVYWPN
jgi:arylsulfatase A-like enzyme